MITARIAEQRASVINPLHPRDPGLASLYGLGQESSSGESVTPTTALAVEAFLGGVNYLGRTVASLPLPVYERLEPRGRRRAMEHRLYEVLHDQPNRFQTSFEWRYMLMLHVLLRGNFYSRILPDGRLVPYHPDRVTPFWGPTGERAYEYVPPAGAPNGIADRIILQSEMLHVTYMPEDGLRGRSVLEYQRDTIGQAIASTKLRGAQKKIGDRLGGVLTVKKRLSPEAKQSLREQWQTRYSGTSNAGRTAILEEDMDWKPVTMTAQDAQTAQLLELDRESMAIILGIPPHKVGANRHSTFSNIEHQAIEAVQDAIRPWCVSIEQAFRRDLFSAADRRRFYAEFNLDGLLRGDFLSRQQGLEVQRRNGVISGNDWAETENMNEFPGGDVRIVPLNMVPLTQIALPGAGSDPAGAQRRFPERRSVEMIRRLRSAHGPIIEDGLRRLLRREADSVERQFRRQAQERSLADFMSWADTFYGEFRGVIVETMGPSMSALADTVAVEASQMVGAETPDVSEFASGYVAALAARHISASRNALLALVSTTDAGAMLVAAEGLFRSWRSERPRAEAGHEAVRLSNAVSREVWQEAGVQRLQWLRAGECQDCDVLDGKVIGIREAFAEGVQHPPLHDSCSCTVIPVLGG